MNVLFTHKHSIFAADSNVVLKWCLNRARADQASNKKAMNEMAGIFSSLHLHLQWKDWWEMEQISFMKRCQKQSFLRSKKQQSL